MRTTYKGYTFSDVTTPTANGRFKARVAIMVLQSNRTLSQRFLDLETFATKEQAQARIIDAAKAWIDIEIREDRLDLPTNFGTF